MRSSAMFASAMSSSRMGPWPHHSDTRCPRTRRSSANLSRYSNSTVSESFQTARDLIELRVTVDLFGAGVEKRSRVVARARRDHVRRNDPHAHDAPAPSINVARILQCHLGVGCVHAPRMLVRLTVRALRE